MTADDGAATGEGAGNFDRVVAGYRLNEALTRNAAARAVKSAANLTLSASRLGDSIRIGARR